MNSESPVATTISMLDNWTYGTKVPGPHYTVTNGEVTGGGQGPQFYNLQH